MKKKNIFIAIIIVLLVGGVILILLSKGDVGVRPEDGSVPSVLTEEEKDSDVLEKIGEQEEEKFADPLIVLQKQLENRARFFIERYNTYSSDNNQENLRSLLSQVSNKLAKEIEARLIKKINQDDNFFSFQTKVLSLNLSNFIDNEKAVFVGQIQTQEIHNEQTEIHYKTAILEFIYENQEWKVDNIEIK